MARRVCSFTVLGTPKPQGSMAHVGKGRVAHHNEQALLPWRQNIAWTYRHYNPGAVRIDAALAVRATFYFARPKDRKRRAAVYATTAYDLDKLQRAVGDALNEVLYRDDAQIVHWHTWKLWTDADPRVELEIWELDQSEVPAIERGAPQLGLF